MKVWGFEEAEELEVAWYCAEVRMRMDGEVVDGTNSG